LSPYYCFKCKKFLEYGYLCNNCLKEVGFSLNIFCPKCKRRKPLEENISSICCSNLIRSLITFSDYENEFIKNLIKMGKFMGFYKIFEFLGNLASSEIKKYKLDFKNYMLTYIPMYKKDEKQRGFNQSKILAETISKNLNLRIFEGLKKTKQTKLQSTLNFEERFKNIENAFECICEAPKNILLVDDVITTGATSFECAKILKEKGAKKIILLTIAK